MVDRQPYIEYTLRDDSSSTTVRRFHIARGTQIDAGLSAATSLRGPVAALSGCVFLDQAVVYESVEPRPAAPLAGVMAGQVGTFVYSCAEPGEYAIVLVPGIRDEVLLAEGPQAGIAINTEHPAVLALTAALTAAWCNPFGFAILSLEAAFLQQQVRV
jgi:hypothetical protein